MTSVSEHALRCIGATLFAMPALITVAYVLMGWRRRANELRKYLGSADLANEIAPPVQGFVDSITKSAPAPDRGDMTGTLGAHMEKRYVALNPMRNYFLVLPLFYSVYGMVIYWGFYSWGVETSVIALDEPKTPDFWTLVRLGGVGALGAILGVVWHLFWRAMRLDLLPRTFIHLSARLFGSPFLALALASGWLLITDATTWKNREGIATFIAFGAGIYGADALRAVKVWWGKFLGVTFIDSASLSLEYIQGMDTNDQLRLLEEGIVDVQHLANASVVALVTSTGYSFERLVDWQDQAILAEYVCKNIGAWRGIFIRSALDVLSMAHEYYKVEDRNALVQAIAKQLGTDETFVRRLIDGIYNDRRVYQLWLFSRCFYPEKQSVQEAQPGSAA